MLTKHSERRCDILSFGFTIVFQTKEIGTRTSNSTARKKLVKLKKFVENEVQTKKKTNERQSLCVSSEFPKKIN